MVALRQTALFQLISLNKQNELIPAPAVAIQNRDVLKKKQEAQNGVTCAKPHQDLTPNLNCSFSFFQECGL